ncbi:MAG: hypothetical protein WC792_00765 [Candidatus Micrarchaeia archaeon]
MRNGFSATRAASIRALFAVAVCLAFFAQFSPAYSLSLSFPAELGGILEYNDSAKVSLSAPSGGCGETIYATVLANKSFYKKMFLQGVATAGHWQQTCGFVRGHCGYAEVSVRNNSGELFSSQSPSCLQLEDYSASFSGVLLAENSSANAQISFSAFETHSFDSEQWGLPISINSIEALLSREQPVRLSGNSTIENGKISTSLWLVLQKTGELRAQLPTGAYSTKVFVGKKHALSFSAPSAQLLAFSVAQISNATQAFAPKFKAIAWGEGGGACAFSGLPPDARRISVRGKNGNLAPYDFAGGAVSWACNLSAGNYSVYFESGNPLPHVAAFPGQVWVVSVDRVDSSSSQTAAKNAGNNESNADVNSSGVLPRAEEQNSSVTPTGPPGNDVSQQPGFAGRDANESGVFVGDAVENGAKNAGNTAENASGSPAEPSFVSANGSLLPFSATWGVVGLQKAGIGWENSSGLGDAGDGLRDGVGAEVGGELGGDFDENPSGENKGGNARDNPDAGKSAPAADGRNGDEIGGERAAVVGGVPKNAGSSQGGFAAITALAFSDSSGSALVALAVACALLAARAMRSNTKGLKLTKKLNKGGTVQLLVCNDSGEYVSSVVLWDFSPEGSVPEKFSQVPEISDTLIGKRLQWKREKLAKGETWKVGYCLPPAAGGQLLKARVRAFGESGARLSAESN